MTTLRVTKWVIWYGCLRCDHGWRERKTKRTRFLPPGVKVPK